MKQSTQMEKELEVIASLSRLQKVILNTQDLETVVQDVVNATLDELIELGFDVSVVVLNLIDEKNNVLRRTSISHTQVAKKAVEGLPIPFQKIKISMNELENYCVLAIKKRTHLIAHSWDRILSPPVPKVDAVRLQKAVGVQTSIVFPLFAQETEVGSMIFSFQKDIRKLSPLEEEILSRVTDTAGLAVQNSRLYTNLHQANKNIIKANKRLREIDSLKDEFISLASHELRTPMTAIKGYLWMLLNQSPITLPDDMVHKLQVSFQSSERVLRLVNDMLTVSRIAGKRIKINKVSVDLAVFLDQVREEMKVVADEKKIEITCDCVASAEAEMRVSADPDKLRQVLDNIIGNAIKFSPEKSTITLSVSSDQQWRYIRISDKGPGIRPDDKEQLFTKFGKFDHAYKNNPNASGTGLGLYISQQIMHLHGGMIEVESEVGHGTTFIVYLPKTEQGTSINTEDKKGGDHHTHERTTKTHTGR